MVHCSQYLSSSGRHKWNLNPVLQRKTATINVPPLTSTNANDNSSFIHRQQQQFTKSSSRVPYRGSPPPPPPRSLKNYGLKEEKTAVVLYTCHGAREQANTTRFNLMAVISQNISGRACSQTPLRKYGLYQFRCFKSSFPPPNLCETLCSVLTIWWLVCSGLCRQRARLTQREEGRLIWMAGTPRCIARDSSWKNP